MGLDMYAYKTKQNLDAPVDFNTDESDVEIAYWRKHPNLHGWMERLYYAKGGTKDSFNCVPVELDITDLHALRLEVEGERLPETSGFFFGKSQPEDRTADLEFITEAIKAIEAGERVYYTSWW